MKKKRRKKIEKKSIEERKFTVAIYLLRELEYTKYKNSDLYFELKMNRIHCSHIHIVKCSVKLSMRSIYPFAIFHPSDHAFYP